MYFCPGAETAVKGPVLPGHWIRRESGTDKPMFPIYPLSCTLAWGIRGGGPGCEKPWQLPLKAEKLPHAIIQQGHKDGGKHIAHLHLLEFEHVESDAND